MANTWLINIGLIYNTEVEKHVALQHITQALVKLEYEHQELFKAALVDIRAE